MWIGRYWLAVKFFSRENYDPECSVSPPRVRQGKKLQDLNEAQDGNLIVYSGYSPFVGSGFDIGGWSFALNLQKGVDKNGEKLQPKDFELGEIYDYLRAQIKGLDLENTSIDEKVFVSGHEVRNDKRFLSHPFSKPYAVVSKEVVDQVRDNPTQSVRYYQCVRTLQFSGDIVLSIYLRLWKVGQSLFIESSYYVLPPIDKKYRKVDEYAPRPANLQTWLRRIWVFPVSYIITPFVLLRSLFTFLYEILYPMAKWLVQLTFKLLIREVPMYDYGIKTSIREMVSSNKYDQFFQKLDTEMYLKVVERQILDSLIDFLKSHNIDTSELKEREASILNHGLIMYGGSIRAETLAIGKKASAKSTTRVSRPTGRPVENTAEKRSLLKRK
jgi:hypothetical protein